MKTGTEATRIKSPPPPPARLHLKTKRAAASFESFGATASCGTFGRRAERITASPADSAQNASGEAVAHPASDPTLLRSLCLAAPVATAAILGAFVGSFFTGGVARFWPSTAPSFSNIVASGGMQSIKAELIELSALKTNLETATRNLNDQFARLTERLDRIERAETEPNGKLAHIVEAVDRLEKDGRSAMASSFAPVAVETTGTIPKNSTAPAEAERPEKVLPDWILHAVRGTRALVENRRGTSLRSRAAACFPASAGSRRSSGRATIGSS
jgi:hypothetical protein